MSYRELSRDRERALTLFALFRPQRTKEQLEAIRISESEGLHEAEMVREAEEAARRNRRQELP